MDENATEPSERFAITKTHFSVKAMHQQIDHLHSLIHDAVVADKHKLYSTDLFEKSVCENVKLEHPDEEIIGLKLFLTGRVESIKAQLRGERKGYIIKR